MRDPHDDLLLTDRDTTIVTQGTALADTMPDPYGSSQDEEALFSDVGADDGSTPNRSRMRKNARKSQRAPGMWLEADDASGTPAPATPAAAMVVAPAMPMKSLGMLVLGSIATAWLARRLF